MTSRGAYTAKRAAALAGVPLSTVHWWARNDVLGPSVSPVRIRLWSYSDLMGLRIIHWLRHSKEAPDGVEIPATTMPAVRRALARLDELDLQLWSDDGGPAVRVDRRGDVWVVADEHSLERPPDRQRSSDEVLDVLEPFPALHGRIGPDLREPRPELRIVPGKLGGAPHVAQTRLESEALSALAGNGLPTATIYRLYPSVEARSIDAALDLERQLDENLLPA